MYSTATSTRALPGKFAMLSATVLGAGLLALPVLQATAADAPNVSLGAGMRASFTHADSGAGTGSSDFSLNSARLYINGGVTDQIKFTFNTEYTGDTDNKLQVMDAIARFEFSDAVNIWAGRFLPPSDRANLYGPYYANNWNVYVDGVQDNYPNVAVGRDNGAMYWGQFGNLKLSAGVFDVPDTFGHPTAGHGNVLWAGRAMYDFWDKESGYYLNSTYYGDKDLLALGADYQVEGDFSYYGADFLFEKKLGNAGAVTVEAEWQKQEDNPSIGPDLKHDGYYVLAAYVFPQVVGIGKFQVLGKYGEDDYSTDKRKTSELNLNYLIKAFNARASLYYLNQSYPGSTPDFKAYGIGIQLQM